MNLRVLVSHITGQHEWLKSVECQLDSKMTRTKGCWLQYTGRQPIGIHQTPP